MRAAVACCVALLLASAVLGADDHSVIFDEDVDFAVFKTFIVRDVRVVSERPELKFPAVAKALATTLRTVLTKRLTEVTDRGDLIVECRVTGVDYGIGPFGRASVVQPGRSGRGGQPRTLNVDFTEATMVLDLTRGATAALVWRGVYHDSEKDPQILASALIEDATRLLSQYPPKKK